jgi:hypothetical protein
MVKILTILLIIAQFLDGILTHVGVSRFGIQAEANPLIVLMIEFFGLTLALIVAKTIGVILAIIIHKIYHLSSKSHAVFASMIAVNILYWGRAILPWTIALMA